ncbi:MAG: hypothetical protein M3237_03955 [Actinomycetota bacterium]|nr:hypothetical protein [Actinomycetota bacterium]
MLRYASGSTYARLLADRIPHRVRLPHDVLMHDGGTGGYRSFAAVAPTTGTAVVVLTDHAAASPASVSG